MGTILGAAFLGLVQGITEFLPVSSTAHLRLLQLVFGFDETTYGLTFDLVLTFATTMAVIIYFWNDLVNLTRSLRIPSKAMPLTPSEQMPWVIAAVTIVVAVIGLVAKDAVETTLRSPYVIAISLVVVGVVMLLAEGQLAQAAGSSTPSAKHLAVTGLAQAIAFIPGVSRSGITMSTGIFAGLDRPTAARYSFLLSVPITLLATLKGLSDFAIELTDGTVPTSALPSYVVGALVAGIVGYMSIRFLLRFLGRSTLKPFVYYRFALAAVILIALAFGK